MNQEQRSALQRIIRQTDEGITLSKAFPPAGEHERQKLAEAVKQTEQDLLTLKVYLLQE
jgi:hypothetical protein